MKLINVGDGINVLGGKFVKLMCEMIKSICDQTRTIPSMLISKGSNEDIFVKKYEDHFKGCKTFNLKIIFLK